MNRSSNSKSSLFLMEMMIAILFFSLASAVCLRMFTKSSQMSKATTNLNMAVNQAGNAAELLKAAGQASSQDTGFDFPGLDLLLTEYPGAVADSSKTLIFYDKEWNQCDEADSSYFMQIGASERESFLVYQIEVFETGVSDAIYSVDLELYRSITPSLKKKEARL